MSASLSPKSVPPSGPFTSKEASDPGEEGTEPGHMETGKEASDLVSGLWSADRPLQRSLPCTLGLKLLSTHLRDPRP